MNGRAVAGRSWLAAFLWNSRCNTLQVRGASLFQCRKAFKLSHSDVDVFPLSLRQSLVVAVGVDWLRFSMAGRQGSLGGVAELV